MTNIARIWVVFLLTVLTGTADTLRVGTLNCFLLFSPSVDHPGKIDEENAMSPDVYESKLDNLASLAKLAELDVISVQEVGGREEVAALANRLGMEYCYAKGKDTYTGQNVAILFNPKIGYKAISVGRVGELDYALSKHVLLKLSPTGKGNSLYFLAVHLIRPIGPSGIEKHEKQLVAVRRWADGVLERESEAVVVVAGDTNNARNVPGGSCFGFGREAGELNFFKPTHINGKTYDRLVVAGNGTWVKSWIVIPPFGKKPNDSLLRVNTDHFLLAGTLSHPE